MFRNENLKKHMENILGSLGWFMLFVTIIVVGLTVLTLNGVMDTPYFGNYFPVGLSLLITQVIWGIRFYYNSRRYSSYFKYSIFALVFALIQLIFLLSNVY